jgi:hypothetical protein
MMPGTSLVGERSTLVIPVNRPNAIPENIGGPREMPQAIVDGLNGVRRMLKAIRARLFGPAEALKADDDGFCGLQ